MVVVVGSSKFIAARGMRFKIKRMRKMPTIVFCQISCFSEVFPANFENTGVSGESIHGYSMESRKQYLGILEAAT